MQAEDSRIAFFSKLRFQKKVEQFGYLDSLKKLKNKIKKVPKRSK